MGRRRGVLAVAGDFGRLCAVDRPVDRSRSRTGGDDLGRRCRGAPARTLGSRSQRDDALHRLERARRVHGGHALRTGLCHRRAGLPAADRSAARACARHDVRRSGQHGVSPARRRARDPRGVARRGVRPGARDAAVNRARLVVRAVGRSSAGRSRRTGERRPRHHRRRKASAWCSRRSRRRVSRTRH